jgi:diacylglycerol O-acyltransferase / wax synthase
MRWVSRSPSTGTWTGRYSAGYFPMPVYLAGASVRMQYAFAPTIGAGLNVTQLSYVDTCALGINVDTGAIPDFDVFYDCLVAGFDDVLALAS